AARQEATGASTSAAAAPRGGQLAATANDTRPQRRGASWTNLGERRRGGAGGRQARPGRICRARPCGSAPWSPWWRSRALGPSKESRAASGPWASSSSPPPPSLRSTPCNSLPCRSRQHLRGSIQRAELLALRGATDLGGLRGHGFVRRGPGRLRLASLLRCHDRLPAQRGSEAGLAPVARPRQGATVTLYVDISSAFLLFSG